MDRGKLVKLHGCIAKLHVLIFGSLFLYMSGTNLIFNRNMLPCHAVCSGIVFGISIADYIYSVMHRLKRLSVICMFRAAEGFMIAVSISNMIEQPYSIAGASIMFVSVSLQVMHLSGIKQAWKKILMLVIMQLPMCVFSIIQALDSGNYLLIIDTVMFNFLLFFIILTVLGVIYRIFEENHEEKNARYVEQLKIKEHTYEKLSRENSEMLIENLIQQYISSSLEITNLMQLILESLSEAMVVNLCCIVVKDITNQTYQYKSRATCEKEKLDRFNGFIENESLIKEFETLRKPYTDNRINQKKYAFLSGMPVSSLMICPLLNKEEWLGMLVIGKEEPDYFVRYTAFYKRVAAQFSVALTNANTYTRMEDMAMKDGLTGIYNRIYLTNRMNEYISAAVREQISVSLLLFDIDKFKAINDQYGHLFGDEVIRICAGVAKDAAERYGGFAARYGGEEFVIVCRERPMEKLREMGMFLQNTVSSKTVHYRGQTIHFNISAGLASYPHTCLSPADLTERADQALYYSKKHGRGRLTVDGEYKPLEKPGG